jgi:hypothetical protein
MGHCLRELLDMLTCTTADFQHVALPWQYAHQEFGERPFVSFSRRLTIRPPASTSTISQRIDHSSNRCGEKGDAEPFSCDSVGDALVV